ncbi:hypothetical protein LDO32_02195 [Luteimonas sp. Y-2-2-4F]|nr:hypothetical protein [Luteimonas sp. Y-2-2-4F]MCD9030545.1 hypothetical protein [Luteimonas sp. Y-2-2-4F]
MPYAFVPAADPLAIGERQWAVAAVSPPCGRRAVVGLRFSRLGPCLGLAAPLPGGRAFALCLSRTSPTLAPVSPAGVDAAIGLLQAAGYDAGAPGPVLVLGPVDAWRRGAAATYAALRARLPAAVREIPLVAAPYGLALNAGGALAVVAGRAG